MGKYGAVTLECILTLRDRRVGGWENMELSPQSALSPSEVGGWVGGWENMELSPQSALSPSEVGGWVGVGGKIWSRHLRVHSHPQR